MNVHVFSCPFQLNPFILDDVQDDPESISDIYVELDDDIKKRRCFLIVSLMQKFQRSTKKRDPRKSEEYINFRLYKVNLLSPEKKRKTLNRIPK